MKNHFPSKDDEIVIENDRAEEKVVLIRPGGYEEEIAFQAQQAEKTRAREGTRTTGQREVELEGFRPSVSRAPPTTNQYIGTNELKFKEEILSKLELAGSDAKMFTRDRYSREVLYKELRELSLKPMETVSHKLDATMKFEALAMPLSTKAS